MKTLLILALLTASALAADPGFVYLDLSGPWRWTAADDPRFAAPEFDDSAWSTESLPHSSRSLGTRLARQGFSWHRRAVDLPPQARGQRLSLTVGAIREGYQVFVNGRLVGDTGPFSLSELRLARPRVFDLPSLGDAPRAVIALRVWEVALRGTMAWNVPDAGPWLLTSPALAPRQAGQSAIERQRLRRIGDIANPLVVLSLATVILLVWFNARGQRELLWLSLFLVAASAGRLIRYLEITPEAQPFGWPAYLLTVVGRLLPPALQAQFIAATFRMPWVSRTAWPLALIGAGLIAWLPPDVERQYFVMIGFLALTQPITALTNVAIGLVGFAALLRVALRPPDRHEVWQGAGRYILLVGTALAVVSQLINTTTLAPILTPVLGASLETYVTPLAAIGMTLVIARRLLRDRDEKLRLAGELEAARGIQQLLLPSAQTSTTSHTAEAAYQPASEVGGDFYWTRAEPDGALLVVVGDVSGKGLRAAMLVSVAVGILRNERSSSPAAILTALNRGLAGHTGGGFVTACCARFDLDGTVTIASAGHPAPYADGRELEVATGLPLGIVTGVAYDESTTTGHHFTFVSDGVVEAENTQRELFGFDRTREISTKSAREIAEAAKAWGQNDDITVVTVRRNA